MSRESQAHHEIGRSVFEGSKTTQQQQCTASTLVTRPGQRQRAPDRPVHPNVTCCFGVYNTELDRLKPLEPGSSVEEKAPHHTNTVPVRHCEGREGHNSARHMFGDRPRQAQKNNANEFWSELNPSQSI